MDHTAFLILIYSSFFAAVICFSLLLNGLMLKFSANLGMRNIEDGEIRWSSTTKPALGGISFYLVFLLSIASYNVFFQHSPNMLNQQLFGFLAASTLGFLSGLYDDAYNTKPLLKLGAQIMGGIILIATGTSITLFGNDIANYLLTVFWVVAVMNSINMLDNMDGITTIVSSFIILMVLLVIFIYEGYSHIHAMALIGLLAGLLGFLRYNWNPAKMYMGDTGSQFLGIFLAAIGIIYFWNNKSIGAEEIPTKQVVITALAFIIPIIDSLTVTINRIAKGNSPLVGGKDHTTHHLSYLGLNDKQIALLFSGISLLSLIFIYLIIEVIPNWGYFYVILFALYFLSVFGLLFGITKTRKGKIKLDASEKKYLRKTT